MPFGIGGGYEKSKSKESSFHGLDPLVRGAAAGQYGSYLKNLQGGALRQGEDLFNRTIGGEFLDPRKVPGFAEIGDYAKSTSEDILGRAFRDIRSSAGKAGIDTGSAAQSLMTEEAGRTARGMGQSILSALLPIYQQERGYMTQGPLGLLSLLTGQFDPLQFFKSATSEGSGKSRGMKLSVGPA